MNVRLHPRGAVVAALGETGGDDVFRRLSACHNVLFTGHQAFLTKEALLAIASTTLDNVRSFLAGSKNGNEVE